MFASFFSLPANPLKERPIQFDGTLLRTVSHADTAVPTFIWEKDNRAIPLFRMGNQDVHRAYFDAMVATRALLLIKQERPIGRHQIGSGMDSLFHFGTLSSEEAR